MFTLVAAGIAYQPLGQSGHPHWSRPALLFGDIALTLISTRIAQRVTRPFVALGNRLNDASQRRRGVLAAAGGRQPVCCGRPVPDRCWARSSARGRSSPVGWRVAAGVWQRCRADAGAALFRRTIAGGATASGAGDECAAASGGGLLMLASVLPAHRASCRRARFAPEAGAAAEPVADHAGTQSMPEPVSLQTSSACRRWRGHSVAERGTGDACHVKEQSGTGRFLDWIALIASIRCHTCATGPVSINVTGWSLWVCTPEYPWSAMKRR